MRIQPLCMSTSQTVINLVFASRKFSSTVSLLIQRIMLISQMVLSIPMFSCLGMWSFYKLLGSAATKTCFSLSDLMTSIYFDIEIRLDLLESNIVNLQVQHLSGARSTLRVPKVMTIRAPWHRDSLGFKCFKCINLSRDENLVNTSCKVFQNFGVSCGSVQPPDTAAKRAKNYVVLYSII